MNSSSLINRILLLTAFVSMLTGCGSGGSGVAGSTTPGGTGSIAAKLVWSGTAKSTGKTLYAAPAGVTTIKVFVYDADMVSLITPKDFPASAGSGTIDGIPVGSGRIVKVWGLDSLGYLLYEATASNITISLAAVTTVPVTMLPKPSTTTASPPFGNYTAPQYVTLTAALANTTATIYYTTNGAEPTISSTSGSSPLQNILIFGKTVIKFFSVNSIGATEPVKFGNYSTAVR